MRPEKCIGCQACVDFCPNGAITFGYDMWGEGRATINTDLCIDCGACYRICPDCTIKKNDAQESVYAVFSKKHRHTGSSGGVFYELASRFIEAGGVVYGAAFDENLKLVHKKVTVHQKLTALCKSKYLHSDMTGIYKDIEDSLKTGNMVMFVGTPCQVSAVKNLFLQKYSSQLLLVDFLCHGTGTQKILDLCIKDEERKVNGKIIDFTFRAKSKKAEHSFKYKFKQSDRIKERSGYSFEFPYYFSYLKYSIFYECCYSCKYPTQSRVGDITLGDFWGIQNFDKKLSDQKGVSMISVNTEIGRKYFDGVKSDCKVYEYPIESATQKNQAFKENVSESCHSAKQGLMAILQNDGDKALVNELRCKDVRKRLIYVKIPKIIKKLLVLVRGLI